MPKQVLQVTNFAGGLNAYADPRDVEDNQFVQNWNAVVDKDGIIRVSGMATDTGGISTDYHTSEKFQKGHGLFQFSTDYGIADIASSFGTGLTTGTRAGSNSTTAHNLEDKTSTSSTDADYVNRIMFIYAGTGIGQSRIITAYDYTGGATERLVTTEAFAVSLDTTSKYIIFNWKVDATNWAGKDDVVKKDFITNGFNAAMLQSIPSENYNDYYIFSRKAGIADEQSENLGYIEYGSGLSLTPGFEYTLSFDCAAKDEWYNLVSKSKDTGITTDNTGGTVSATTASVTIDVDNGGSGSIGADLAAMQALILDRQVYNSDQVFIGLCTAVAYSSTSDGTVTFGNGIAVDITNNTDLYVGEFGDKVPWVQLYSEDVADTKGSLKTLDAVAVSTSAAWTDAQTYKNQYAYSSTGNGQGAVFNIVTSGSGGTATFHFVERGHGYVVDEELLFYDPAGSGRTATIVVNAINITGLSLYASQDTNITSWKSGIVANGAVSKYISYVHNNYIANGDFTAGNTGWTVGSAVTAAEASQDSQRYGGHDGTLLLSRTGSSLVNPVNNSWDAYIYADIALDENTLYHLNFLYDAYQGQGGLTYAIYNQTESKWIIEPRMLGVTRDAFLSDGIATSVNFIEGGRNQPYSDSSNMNYIPFKVGNITAATTATIRIAFAKTLSGHDTTRLAGVTVYKAHNDLVTMNYKNSNTNNPFTSEITSFSKYLLKFKIPENYSTDDGWILRLHAGQYGNRNSNTIAAPDEQEVYFDNIRLSSDNGDTITLLTNNTNDSSNISLYTSASSAWHSNFIKWQGLNSKPTYDYINGMLKISDGNFNNSNSNKLLYYINKEGTTGSGKLGWIQRDDAIQSPPSISASSIFVGQYTIDVNDCVEFLNTQLGDVVGNYHRGNGVGSMRNGRAYAAAYGPSHIQGFVTRYWHSSYGNELSGNTLFTNEGAAAGQNFIPRYDHDGNGGTSTWYEENVISDSPNSYVDAGGYESSAFTIATGPIDLENRAVASDDNEVLFEAENIHFETILIKAKNALPGDWDETHNRISAFKDIGIPSDCLQDISNPSAGDVGKIEIEFEFECFAFAQSEAAVNDRVAPSFEIKIGKPESSNVTNDAIMTDVNTNYEPIEFNPIFERTYGSNSNSSNLLNQVTSDNYNASGDSGECVSVNLGVNTSKDMSRFKVIFKDSFEISDGTISKDDNIIIQVRDILDKDSGGDSQNFSGLIYITGDNAYSKETGTTGVDKWRRNLFKSRNQNSAIFTRFMINKLNIMYHNLDAPLEGEPSGFTDTSVSFQWDAPLDDTSLNWGERAFKIGVSTVNIFGEESSISQYSDIIGGLGEPTEDFPDGEPIIKLGFTPTIIARLSNSVFNNSYLTKTNFYMKDENSDIWYLQFFIDHKKGVIRSTTSGVDASRTYDSSTGTNTWTLDRENLKNFNEVNSYESESGVSQDDGLDASNLTCRYKTSTIANNRMYVGNIMQKGRIYGDRMLKSPIGKYNILPSTNFIDVAINDGDEITALAYYKDKILQFKKRKVFVINISGDYEFLEDTFDNVGVLHQASVTKTPHGIVWANKSGCYLYDGQQMTNLIDGKISTTSDYSTISNNYWLANLFDGDCVVGYIQDRDTLLIKWTSDNKSSTAIPDSSCYHFPTKSWVFNHEAISGTGNSAETGSVSNMITDVNGDLLYYRFDDTPLSFNGIKKWNNSSLATGYKIIYFTTKDFTFGNIVDRKKIYKVYLTYKTTDGSNSLVTLNAGTNGGSQAVAFSASASKFAGTSTACYHASNGLLDTGGDWKIAELKFTTPSTFNNIYSFQLQFIQSSITSTVDVGFQINDISIVFKTKRTK